MKSIGLGCRESRWKLNLVSCDSWRDIRAGIFWFWWLGAGGFFCGDLVLVSGWCLGFLVGFGCSAG